MLKPENLHSFIQTNNIQAEMLHLDTLTPTVESAAQAVGTEPDNIVKSILFLVDGKPILAIACGQARVDSRAIAALYGVGRKRVKLAPPEVVLKETGYEVGAMPPFGHLYPLETLLDRRVLERPVVFAGGGSEQTLIRLSPQAILEATGARILDLFAPEKPSEEPFYSETGG